MSVCFFVPATSADAASTSNAGEKEEVLVTLVDESQAAAGTSAEQWNGETSQQQLQQFWNKVQDDIQKATPVHFKNQVLPLARIKKIMKLDEDVKMISAEAPVLFAKAAEIFIHELTLRAWAHTEDNKRRTLQKNDIAMAISKSDQFDFLIDIVPRHEVKAKAREDPPKTGTEQVVQSSSAPAAQPQIVVQGCGQVVQGGSSGGVSLMQQIVTPSGEVQQMPIQLSQAQLNLIRLQMASHPAQPILIQTAQQLPQMLQVSSQAQQPQQVYIAQETTSDDS